MSCSDPIADMLTKIRNASLAKNDKVEVTSSKSKLQIITILKNEGYIKDFKIKNGETFDTIKIYLKYDEKGEPVIRGIKKLSIPGRRLYSGYKDMPRVFNGYGTLVVSTSSGIITGKKAQEEKVGGELIAQVW